MKKILLIFVMFISLMTFVGCGEKTTTIEKDILRIGFVEAGYGRDWLVEWANDYQAENPNVEIILEGNPNMTANVGPKIENSSDLADVYFLLETNWQKWATMGYLEPLDDLYASEVEDGVTLEDKLIDEVVDFGLINDHYYSLPWNDGVTGIVYNAGMFEDKGWEVPETFDELVALTEQIKTEGAGIKPFTWPGQYSAYWNFAVYGWWAQIEGIEGMNEFFRFESPDVFLQQGKLKAMQAYETLIGDQSNSINGVNGLIHTQAQMQFVNGLAAMIPNGIWIEKEMEAAIPEGFEMKMMQLPTLEGAVETKINNSMLGDFIIIPKEAANKELAKDFLLFISRDAELIKYTEMTGSPRPFEYDPTQIEGLSPFVQSCLQIWKESTNLYIISKNPMYFGNLLNTFPKSGPLYGDIYLGDETAQSVIQGDYDYVVQNWDEFRERSGMVD
ncbi:ABC transporter substrate-binding protein [Candidatus Izemoplasma sp. B36]|uniref:ABC transporter substrate-binding protein n=1 Tax=Candidatus Izemoplasma sp. B36 TaxID=3242468 RepID=UPI0035589EB6